MCGLLCIYLFGRLVDYNIGCKLQICKWHGVSLLDPNGRKGHANCVESIFVVHAFLNVFCSHCLNASFHHRGPIKVKGF